MRIYNLFIKKYMPTTKKRVNVSLSDNVDFVLEKLSKRDNMPKATKAAQLIDVALELEEDQFLDEVASARDTKKAKFVSHKKAWV